MKETGMAHWFPPNGEATNESGMTALPAGSRTTVGGYQNITTEATFWSATQSTSTDAWCRRLSYNTAAAGRADYEKTNGFSVRCVKD